IPGAVCRDARAAEEQAEVLRLERLTTARKGGEIPMGKSKGGAVQRLDDVTLERLTARAVSKLSGYATPWVTAAMVAGLGAGSHALWGDPGRAAWAAMAETSATLGLAAAAVTYSAGRSRIVRVHSVGTVAASGTWVTVTTIAGMSPTPVWSLWLGGGAVLALSWNIRQAVMPHPDRDGEAGGGDRITTLLDSAARKAGIETKAMHVVEATDRRATVRATLEGGTVAEDMQRKAAEIESAARLPPGAVTVTGHDHRADQADVTVSDPRVLRRPIPWPGPSRPGASIAEPLRVGLWQDGEDVEHTIVGHHLQIMGKSGSGKSEGAAWNYLAEMVS